MSNLKPKIIAIANQKGGCGKTATSINLAAALAEKGKKVLLVDLDPQLHATEGVGVDPEKIKINVYNLLFDVKTKPADVIVGTETENLDLIPSSVELEKAESRFYNTRRAEYRLDDKLKNLNDYDFVFFDCPPRLDHLTVNALTAAHRLIIPISTIGKRSLRNLDTFLEYVEDIKSQINSRLEIMGYLANMHRKGVKVSEYILNKIKEDYKEKVFNTIIPFSAKLAEADLYDEPVVFTYSKSDLATQYRQLAEEIEKR